MAFFYLGVCAPIGSKIVTLLREKHCKELKNGRISWEQPKKVLAENINGWGRPF